MGGDGGEGGPNAEHVSFVHPHPHPPPSKGEGFSENFKYLWLGLVGVKLGWVNLFVFKDGTANRSIQVDSFLGR